MPQAFIVAIGIIAVGISARPAAAQVEPLTTAAGIGLSGAVVGELIEDFEEAAGRVSNIGVNSGNALVASIGNQLSVATRNVEIALDRQRDRTFEELTQQQQQAFTELNRILRAVGEDADRAFSVLEVANLNLIEFTNSLPFTEKTRFWLRQVKGLTQLHGGGDYRLELQGLGFGQDRGDAHYTVSASVGGTDIPVANLQREPEYTLRMRIPQEVMESHFDDDEVTFLPLEVRATVRYSDRCYLIFSCSREEETSWPMKLTLLPKHAGHLTGVELIRVQERSEEIRTTSKARTTQDCTSERPCDWSDQIVLADNQRAVAVRHTCSGQCGWSYNMRSGGYSTDFDILDGGRRVRFYRHNDGEHSTTVTHYVDYVTLEEVIQERPIEPVALRFGSPVTVEMSPDNTGCAYRLTAELVTNQETFIDHTMSQSPDGLVVREGTGHIPGAGCSPTFTLNPGS